MAIEIQSADMQDGSKRLDARVADHRFAVVRLDLAGDEARAIVWPEPLMEFGQEDIGELLTGLLNEAREAGARRLRMTSPSILCRDQARRLGFCGGLREPLTISVDPAPPHRPTDASVDRQGRLLELVDVLNSFGLPTTARARRNVASRWAERLSSGVADLLDIEVSWTPGQVLVLRIPDRADLMYEAIGRCADTACAILRRFRSEAKVVRSITFDRSEWGLIHGKVSGLARPQLFTIHLNVANIAVGDMLELRRRQNARIESRSLQQSLGRPTRYTSIDATTAHEIWHLIERDLDARRFRDLNEIRRQLGQCLGVVTLGKAIEGGRDKAPEAWRRAHDALVTQVSPYAATDPGEATAEMFKAWWCRSGPLSPVVERFAGLLEEYFPADVAP